MRGSRTTRPVILHPHKVPYRETITKSERTAATKTDGSHGQFADADRVEPLPRGKKSSSATTSTAVSIPELNPGVEKGIQGPPEGLSWPAIPWSTSASSLRRQYHDGKRSSRQDGLALA